MDNTGVDDIVIFLIKSTNEKIVKRKARRLDLAAIEKLGQPIEYNIGLHNIQLYFETSQDNWSVAVNERGEIVAYNIYNKLPVGNIQHGYQLVVRPDYRGLGLTRLFDAMHYSKFPATGNATADSLLRYPFQKFGDKLVGFEGLITDDIRRWIKEFQVSNNPDIKLERINTSNIFDILAYDLTVLGFDRSVFLSEWILPNKYPCRSLGFLAKGIDGKIRGFGVIREYDGYFTLAPLYADDDSTARLLLYALASDTPEGIPLFIYFPAKNRLITEFVHKSKFVWCDCEIRDYNNNVPQPYLWDMSKVYALHEYYPV